ncbi:unnamed protein product [Rhizoctonia solani]|uniref:Uncharacterized protein n=1 Tax=Rhizoctonia solani TaxID=456999 RepID=A0A8H2XJC1_9AGAM|nr:unnamed protein product [Rhizoctonia solani]
MVPRTTSVTDALAAVKGATQYVTSDLNSFTGVIDTAKAVQLAANMVQLEDCIDAAKTAMSTTRGTLRLVYMTNAPLALTQVGEKLQSVKNLKSIRGVGSQLVPIKSGVDALVTEMTLKAQDADRDEIQSLAGPLLSHFSLPL